MNRIELSELINTAFQNNGMGELISGSKCEKLCSLLYALVEANQITNLTAITDENGVVLKHFIDSATICKHIPEGAGLIDVGCGAGFPSLPVAILREDVQVTSLDSTGKKINFLNETARCLLLDNIIGVCDRAESFVVDHREMYDVCTSRAVARMNILSEICVPFIKVGGLFVAMKSNKGSEEMSEAENGLSKLGMSLCNEECLSLTLNNETIEREIYVLEKDHPTPKEYPRNYSQIKKRPL